MGHRLEVRRRSSLCDVTSLATIYVPVEALGGGYGEVRLLESAD